MAGSSHSSVGAVTGGIAAWPANLTQTDLSRCVQPFEVGDLDGINQWPTSLAHFMRACLTQLTMESRLTLGMASF